MENIPSLQSSKPHVVIKWAFVFGIMLLANLFIAYLVQAIYPTPEYENYCTDEIMRKVIGTPEACMQQGGRWYANEAPLPPGTKEGYCDVTRECQESYQDATSLHNRNVFVVFVILGALLLLTSAFVTLSEVIALGLSFAGVLALIIGSMWHWSTMQEWLRVIVLGVALAGILYFAWKKFKI